MKIVFLGLTITSSWGNGHATTFRGLMRELCAQGHDVLFLERDVPWYACQRDLPCPPYGRTVLYGSLDELHEQHAEEVRDADAVIVGSYVPQGVEVGQWVLKTAQGLRAFYDIDTPVTLAKLSRGDYEYLTPALIARYDLYLSFSGGPILQRLEQQLGSPRARALHCSVDPALYYPEAQTLQYDLGYMGTYSSDRQPPLEKLMLTAARLWSAGRFIVAGPMYPTSLDWPANVTRVEHLPPTDHRAFYCAQRFTLNITRADMVAAGYSPSVRLFEAAACGVPIITDLWNGLDTFFTPGKEILLSRCAADTLHLLQDISYEERVAIGERARARVLTCHTAAYRASELVSHLCEAGVA